jgi:xanthine dehydrogenase accessory factor
VGSLTIQKLNEVNVPISLSIQSETPEKVAVSIAAQIIQI